MFEARQMMMEDKPKRSYVRKSGGILKEQDPFMTPLQPEVRSYVSPFQNTKMRTITDEYDEFDDNEDIW